jgi:hypothetical protein
MAAFLLLNLARLQKMKKTYSTQQAARAMDVSFRTLNRWLALGLIRASKPISIGGGRTLWLWTKADIARGRMVKAAQKPGPKPPRRREK